MEQIIVQVSDKLAQRLRPLSTWLPTVLEIGLLGFRTTAVQTASEIIDFLATDPTPADVLTYHVSNRAQHRLRRLLALQAGGQLAPEEQAELDELAQLEHVLICLKAQISAAQANPRAL